MSFAQPFFLIGLLGAAIPIIIHLIHQRRPRKQKFAAIELVMASVRKVERRWRLRRFLLLASRVALIAALAMAAARPLWGVDEATTLSVSGPQRLAIIIDTTLSMRARFDGATTFSRVLTRARNGIDAMGPEDRAVLVAVADPPRLLVERPTGDQGSLLAELRKLEPTFGTGDIGEAVTIGVQALGVSEAAAPAAEGGPADKPTFSARVIVLSDLSQSSLQSPADLRVPGTQSVAQLEIVDVLRNVDEAARRNRAITSVEAAHVPGRAPRTVEIRSRVQSFAREQEDGATEPIDVTLRSEDRDLVAGSADIVAGTIVDKLLRHSFESAGVHSVAVRLEPDALVEDDVRYLSVDVRRQVRVLVVDGAPSGVPKEDEIFYLERALLAGASDQPPPRIIAADDLPRADLSRYDVMVLAGVDVFNRPDGARVLDFVEAGGGLLVTMSESLDAELYNAEFGRLLPRRLRSLKIVGHEGAGAGEPVRLDGPDDRDPITRIFTGEAIGGLQSTRTHGYWLLQPANEPAMNVHLRYSDGQPALVSRAFSAGRVAVLTTSIDRDLTDLPIRPAFVPLMRQLVLYLGRALERPDPRRTLVGQRRIINVPDGAQSLRVVAPDGREQRWTGEALRGDTIIFDQTQVPGHYRVDAAFAGLMEAVPTESFAVNVDPRESNLRPLSEDEALGLLRGQASDGEQPRLAASGQAFGQRVDPDALAALLLALMAVAFVIEGALSAMR